MTRPGFTGLEMYSLARRCKRRECAKEFVTQSRIQLYCSRACKDMVKNEEAKAARKRAKQ